MNGENSQGWLLSPEESLEDSGALSLRPSRLQDYTGQKVVCEQLEIAIGASKNRNENLDHVLLYGPPGLGKTTLASIIASELNAPFNATSGPVLERPGDLAAILANLEKGSVLFIDEIHRLNRAIEEVLYPAMEDFKVDIIVGQGPAARSIQLKLQPFTLIGATTRTGMLTAPLRDRFGIIERLEFYSTEELIDIVKRSAHILEIEINLEGAREIARRARGTPRIANRLLKRTRDFAEQKAGSYINKETADSALQKLGVDENGLDRMDRILLDTIIGKFDGGPVGLDTLAAAINEDKDTIEDVYEPFLLQLGFIRRTARGREATEQAFRLLGYKRSHGPLFELTKGE